MGEHALGSGFVFEECEIAKEEEEVVEGVAAEDVEEDAANDEEEDLDMIWAS